MRKLSRFLSFSTIIGLSLASLGSFSGCAELMKGMGEAAGNMMTEKTASIAQAAVQASYVTNLYPRETQETGMQYLGEAWVPGKNALMMLFYKHKGAGTYDIDGSISYRNAGTQDAPTPMVKGPFGTYSAMLEPNDTQSKEILINTSSGQKMSFNLSPAPAIKISKVNGQASAAQVDLGKDLMIEFENFKPDPNSRLKVSLLSSVLGTRTFVDVGVFKPAAKLLIPAAAFRNLSVSSSSENFVGIDTGSNFLRVERYQIKGSESLKERSVAAFQNLGQSWSTVPVSVSGNARDLSKIEIKGQMPLANNKKLFYNAYVPNAFYGRPFSSGKKFAVASLQLEGTLYEQKTTVSESYGFGYKTVTTTTITKQFPQLPDSHWDQLLQSLHSELSGLLKRQYAIEMLPTEKLMATSSYKELEEAPLENTYRFIKRSYKNSKYLLPRSLGAIVSSVSSTFASDRPMARLMKESGTDGLVSLNLNLQVASDEQDHIILIPSLAYQVYGPPNGYVVGPTTYASGSIVGTGVPFNAQDLSNPASLSRVIQLKELVSGFQQALVDLETKEKAAGYQAIWALN